MLLQTTLFLTLILAAIVLVVATLLRESATRESMRSVLDLWRVASGAAFLACAAGLVAATDASTGSLLAGRSLATDASLGSPEVVGSAQVAPHLPELLESGLGVERLADL